MQETENGTKIENSLIGHCGNGQERQYSGDVLVKTQLNTAEVVGVDWC